MKNVYITEKQLISLLEEMQMLNESKVKVDEFNYIAQCIDASPASGDPDQFFYIEVKKRFKDNPKLYQQYKAKQITGVNCDKYGVYLGSWRVHTSKELLALKPQIVALCDNNNARAYITQNPRSETAVKNYAAGPFGQRMKKVFPFADPENIASGEQQTPFDRKGNLVGTKQSMIQRYGSDRSGFFFDIDAKDPRIAELTKIILKYYGVNVTDERKTPSGGIHIVCDDVFSPNLQKAMEMLRVFDSKFDPKTGQGDMFPDLGQNQLVHANLDGKHILYSNVDTKGY